MNSFRRALLPALAFVLACQAARAADLLVISSMPMDPGLHQLATSFKTATGHNVAVRGLGAADITRILTNAEPFDLLAATSVLVDQALKEGRALAATRAPAGRVGIGVVVKSGGTAPPIATPETLKQAVLSATAVVFNTAGSGQAVQRMFEQMGIAAQIQGKAVRPSNAAETMQRILEGKGTEVGFGLLSEVKPYEAKGIRLVGPLPASLQSYTNYEVIVSSASKSPDAAREFIRFISTTDARKTLAATGVD